MNGIILFSENVFNRSAFIDFLRASSILLMLIYHFIFDLGYFGYHDIDMNNEMEWITFRYIIISGFLLSVGFSLVLAHRGRVRLSPFIKRLSWLLVASIFVSLSSYLIFPTSWIYFGILHFILTASLCAIGLRKHPILCLVLGITILVTYNTGLLSNHFVYQLLQEPLNLPLATEDLVPFFPWFSVVLFGIFLGYFRFYEVAFFQVLTPSWMRWLSRNSLFVYLIHQPIFFAGFYLFS